MTNDASAPERIWLDEHMTFSVPGEPYLTGSPEYTRTDIHDAVTAERDELRARVELMDATIRASVEKLQRDGMKPGWGVVKDWLRAALNPEADT